jgi:hypothetical protein
LRHRAAGTPEPALGPRLARTRGANPPYNIASGTGTIGERRPLMLVAQKRPASRCARQGKVNSGEVMVEMSSAKEYRRRAEECLQLAVTAPDSQLRAALIELAADFEKTAESIEADGAHSPRQQAAA